MIMKKLVLLSDEEQQRRLDPIRQMMDEGAIAAALVTDNANLYYLTGRVFAGMIYLPLEGDPVYLVRRPVELDGKGVVYFTGTREIPAELEHRGLPKPSTLGLEMDITPYTTVIRYTKLWREATPVNLSPLMRQARSVKTEEEIHLIERSGVCHERVYRRIPRVFKPGMTDLELQVEIERMSRLEGCLGQFRISGDTMEIYMGNVITGDNADAPSPYDFAMGGAGLDPSLPVGADGSEIRRGNTVMVDMNGNFTGYMTDMSRTFAFGDVEPLVRKAHECSREILRALERMGRPGVEAKTLYDTAYDMAREAQLESYFMGHRQHAGFVGHGIGIEVNEAPVIAPRSKDILAERNVIALEPKFVIPHVGAVGVENSYAVTPSGLRCLTNAPEDLLPL